MIPFFKKWIGKDFDCPCPIFVSVIVLYLTMRFCSLAARGAQLLMDPSTLNVAIISTYKSACEKYSKEPGSKEKSKTKSTDGSSGYPAKPSGIYMQSPISWSKAIKNDAELQGMKNSHLR